MKYTESQILQFFKDNFTKYTVEAVGENRIMLYLYIIRYENMYFHFDNITHHDYQLYLTYEDIDGYKSYPRSYISYSLKMEYSNDYIDEVFKKANHPYSCTSEFIDEIKEALTWLENKLLLYKLYDETINDKKDTGRTKI